VKKPLTAAAAAKEKAKKHVAAEKAARTRAKDKAEHKPVHHAKVKVSHKPVVKRRKWSPDEGVALCSARAVAESLRIALGPVVSDSAVLTLHAYAGGTENTGTSILAALEAAQSSSWFGGITSVVSAKNFLSTSSQDAHVSGSLMASSVILGLDLPWGEPHAVTYDPRDGTWWSWGQPYSPADFPGAVIEEAWAVSWAQGGDALCAG
jgi:hypothetical protein